MNLERAALKGELAGLKENKTSLVLKIDANIRAAKALLSMSAIKPIDEIDVDGAAVQLSEASALKVKLSGVVAKITAIEKELD